MKDLKLNSKDFFEFYIKNLSHDGQKISNNIDDFLLNEKYFNNNLNIESAMMLFDQKYYLPDDLVVKMERASMASSLEIRLLFYIMNLLNFKNSLPLNYKILNYQGKIITRSILEDYLPKKFFYDRQRRKGFFVPLETLIF